MGDDEVEVRERINNILSKKGDVNCNSEEIANDLRVLRNFCARGSNIQLQIASNEYIQDFLRNILFVNASNEIKHLQTIGWQLMANMTVKNPQSQSLVWKIYGDKILHRLGSLTELDNNVNIILMIIYNVLKTDAGESLIGKLQVLRASLSVWNTILQHKYSEQIDFLHFIFEEFLVHNGRITVQFYTKLNANEKLTFIDYLNCYLRQDNPNGLVHNFILQHISKEFKMKSDCILRVASMQEVDKMKPLESYALLKCIACASGSENYSQLYSKDQSLFLNVSSLLRCIVAASKDSKSTIFSPMNKLEEVAPTSTISKDYQSEMSFELKTLLIRCIANLLYNNDANKGYCLDTQLLPALLECTNMDARNPLMKEWSILAIRNACVGCPEIQQVIANLAQKGPAKNDVLTELNLDMGSLRISPFKE